MYAPVASLIGIASVLSSSAVAHSLAKPGRPTNFNPVPSDRSDGCNMFGLLDNMKPRDECQPAIDKFDDNAVYGAMTVYYGAVHPLNNDSEDHNGTMTCLATFNCTNYGHGLEGISIKYMFAELYARDDFKTCGNLTFDSGCSVSVDSCVGSENCSEITQSTTLAPQDCDGESYAADKVRE